jgi:cardiolipin synthase
MTPRDIPNLITALRILTIIPLVWALAREEYALALTLFVFAGVSDGLDGYLAKRYGWTTRLGAILDPIADKGLLITTYVALAWLGQIPLWLAVGVLTRDAVILVGAFAYYALIGRYEMAPTLISKVNTFLQIAFGVLVVASLAFGEFGGRALDVLAYLVMLATILSGVDYVWTWGRRAWRAWHNQSL